MPVGCACCGCAVAWLRSRCGSCCARASGCTHVARRALAAWLHGCARERLRVPALTPQARAKTAR
eukprot:15197599-Alexandrium_andersonii.AAC.1